MGKLIDITGQRFGKLLVIKKEPSNRCAGARWLCKCDCGNTTTTYSQYLRNGDTKSCGCYEHSMYGKTSLKKPYEWIYNNLKRAAKKSNKHCYITYEEFLDFTKNSKCYYCGSLVKWYEHTSKGIGCCGYNLDRKNNSVGYTKENCVVCCRICNSMKLKMTVEKFVAHIHKIFQNRKFI